MSLKVHIGLKALASEVLNTHFAFCRKVFNRYCFLVYYYTQNMQSNVGIKEFSQQKLMRENNAALCFLRCMSEGTLALTAPPLC